MTNQETMPVVSLTKLLISTGLSLVLAAAILLTFVLPAEYGVDPTGIGKALDLTRLSAAEAAPVTETTTTDSGTRQDSIKVQIVPGKGLEFKLRMQTGAKMKYSWSTEKGSLSFDFHGEPKGDTTGYFESFTLSTADEVSGSFTAPFDGSHGWYWENQTDTPITVTLETEGQYEVLGFM